MDASRTPHIVEHAFGAVNPPVVRSSTFTFPNAAEGQARFQGGPGLLYSRLQNPTVDALEQHLAMLEGAEGAVCTASGMGAIHITLMSLLRPGARLVTDSCVYGCTDSLLRRLEHWGVELVRIDSSDPEALRAAIGNTTAVVFLETPMNPTTRLVDIEQAAAWTHAAGGILVVDNTFATPLAQRPIALGADLVVHSLTKAINGHSDLIAGAVVGPASLLEGVRGWLKDAGPVLDAEAAWLCLRGARTLGVRLKAMNDNALRLAREMQARGITVRHPLLPDHPDHAIALKQMPAGGHVLTIDVGTTEAAHRFVDSLQVFQRAVSLGGFESLASHPATTTHACIPEADRARAGITPGLVRFSIGLDDYEHLRADLERGLEAATAHVVRA